VPCGSGPTVWLYSTISRFGERFRDGQHVWSISCFLFFYSWCPRAQSFVKVGARAPVPWIESASLSCYSFTPESIIKQPFNLNA